MAEPNQTEESHSDRKKRASDELRLLYMSCVAEIATFKQQQWQITNYGLALYAATASVPKLTNDKLVWWELTLLYGLTIAVLLAGWFLIGAMSKATQLRRDRLTAVRDHFTKEFESAWSAGQSKEAIEADKKRDLLIFLCFFRTILVAGAGITTWLLTR